MSLKLQRKLSSFAFKQLLLRRHPLWHAGTSCSDNKQPGQNLDLRIPACWMHFPLRVTQHDLNPIQRSFILSKFWAWQILFFFLGAPFIAAVLCIRSIHPVPKLPMQRLHPSMSFWTCKRQKASLLLLACILINRKHPFVLTPLHCKSFLSWGCLWHRNPGYCCLQTTEGTEDGLLWMRSSPGVRNK